MCKLHKNGCTWNLGACNLNRHNKSIIKNIRGHHTCLAPMLRQDNRKLDKHVIEQIIKPIVKTNQSVYIKMLIAEIKTFMNILQEDMVSKAKSVGDDSWKLRRIICQTAKNFGSFAILCSRDCGHYSNRIRV